MKITEFNRSNLRDLSEDIDAALKAVAEKYGIGLRRGRCTFSQTAATLKFEASVLDKDGMFAKDRQLWAVYCSMYGFKAEHFQASFQYGNKTYTIIGLNLKSRAYPINCSSANGGRGCRFPAEVVLQCLNTK